MSIYKFLKKKTLSNDYKREGFVSLNSDKERRGTLITTIGREFTFTGIAARR